MNKKFSTLLVGAVAFVGLGLFTSCKDYDDSQAVRYESAAAVADLQKQIDEMRKAIEELQKCCHNLFNEDGTLSDNGKTIIKEYLDELEYYVYTIGDDGFWYKDGVNTGIKAVGQDGKNGENGKNGEDGTNGKDADVWTIGDDGYWYVNGVKTDKKAVGTDGKNGENGTNGTNGTNGKDADVWTIGDDGFWYKNGEKTNFVAVGKDGQNGADADKWTIGENGNWFLNGEDTGYKAIGTDGQDGQDGATWTIGDDGYWYLNGARTDYKALGTAGTPGQTPYIGDNGNWWIGTTDTGVPATGAGGEDGEDGEDGKTPEIGANGNWWIGGEDTGIPATGQNGIDGTQITISDDGYWVLDGVKTTWKVYGVDGTNWTDEQIREKVLEIIKNSFGLEDDPLTTDEIEKIVNTIIDNNETIKHLRQLHNDIIATLGLLGYDDFFDFMGQVKQNENDIAQAKKDIEKLKEDVKKLQDAAKKFVTSIELNEAYNPIFGSFNLPINVRSNILFGYYGDAKVGGEFPSVADDGYYVETVKGIPEAAYNLLNPEIYTYSSGALLYEPDADDEDALNIGKLYLTVNPTGADFDGTEFTLVNSLGKEAKAELSPLKKSDHEIKFGYTRVGIETKSPNGFYETNVKINKNDVKSAAIQVTGLKKEVQDIMENLKSASISVDKSGSIKFEHGDLLNATSLIQTIYNNVNGICPAQAVKASWTDEVAGERSVLSQYGIAATALHAVGGYSSFKDFHYYTVPGYEQAWDFIDKVAASIKNQFKSAWPSFDDLKMPTIKYVTFDKPEDDGSYQINIVINFDTESGYTYTAGEEGYINIHDKDTGAVVGRIPFGTVKQDPVTGDFYISVYSYQKNLYPQLEPIFKAIDEAFGDVNKTYKDLEDLLEKVNSALKSIGDMEDAVNNAADKGKTALQKWLATANSYIVNFVNSANFRIQPFLASTSKEKGTSMLSRAKNYPTEIPESTTLIVTNYTGDLIAPALKKYVACTNVFKGDANAQGGDGECQNAMKAVNTGKLNKVLPGSEVFVEASGFKSGYTYELTVAALDYEGYQSAHTFYVTVK